jgi:pilus assembly protein CpaE
VGRTTLAVNLAVALAQASHEDVVLMEASPRVADIELMLNLHPEHTLADMPTDPEEIDDRVLESVLAEHASGIRVLAGWPGVEGLEAYQPTWLARILECLQDMARYVVVDLDSTVDEAALTAIDMCDLAVLVVVPEITALRRSRLFIELMSSAGLGGVNDKLLLILNRAASQGGVNVRDIERQLSLKMVSTIPSQGRVVTASANRGVPVVLGERRSRVSKRIMDLAWTILEREAADDIPARRPGTLDRLGSRLRRKPNGVAALQQSQPASRTMA